MISIWLDCMMWWVVWMNRAGRSIFLGMIPLTFNHSRDVGQSFFLLCRWFDLREDSKENTILYWLVVSTYPSEKWWSESQVGWWHSQYDGKAIKKIHGSSQHQPDIYATRNMEVSQTGGSPKNYWKASGHAVPNHLGAVCVFFWTKQWPTYRLDLGGTND